ncbi:MAG: hypothetical protein VX407_00255, partial [Verrucomicrobiota bacterium]|nr:hypothetical protein [Verrucomicrobiota bacterium]
MEELMNRCHFCKRELSKLLQIFLAAFCLNAFAVASDSIEQNNFDGKAVVIDINNYSFINLIQGAYLKDALDKLNKSNPSAVILDI